MNPGTLVHEAVAGEATPVRTGSAAHALRWRVLVLAGCACAVAMAAWLGDPAQRLAADPELARLLRGMALIKGLLALGAVSLVTWRFGRPVAPGVAVVYVVGCWWLAAAAMLVWQLTVIPFAALGFHAAEISMLVVAWREHRWRTPARY